MPSDGQYAQESWPNVEKDHAAVVTYLDRNIGEILTLLETLNVEENTLVIFASDNGAHNEGGHDHAFFNSTGGLRGFKRSLYEGGYRSPTMVRWPNVVAPNTESDYAWAFWDIMPTFAEIAGVPVPAETDGISILPTLKGQTQPPKDYLYWTWGGAKASGYSVRAGDWKGVVQACGASGSPAANDTMELYHLPSDPFETKDVSHGNPAKVSLLKGLLAGRNLTCTCYQC